MSRPHRSASSQLSNREGYDRWASFYDRYPNPTIAADEESFPPLWSHLVGRRVLEIGCGTGRHTAKLLDQGNDVVGLDASPEMLRVARERLAGRIARLLEADFAVDDVLAGESFDAVITSLVVEHIEALDPFVAKVASMLRPGGEWFLSEIHPTRTAGGTFAHFRDPVSGEDVHLSSVAHSAESIEAAAARHGLSLRSAHDVLGSEALAARRDGWAKYRGMPMVKIWRFTKP